MESCLWFLNELWLKATSMNCTYSKWYKAFLPEELALFVKKPRRVEVIWIFPDGGISMDGPEIRQDDRALRNGVALEL